MSVISGAGAAVASGAGYQARVAAYFVASSLAGLQIPTMRYGAPSKLSLESAEPIDDVKITFTGGRRALIQAKRSISFSTARGAELYSVLSQFVLQQSLSDNSLDEYCLITTSASSRRITGDMLTALDVARGASPEDFERDQPKTIVESFNKLIQTVQEIQSRNKLPSDASDARYLLAKTRVIVLDIDAESSLEQAIVLALHSAGYSASSEMWGKLISDCLEWARRRQTVDLNSISATYKLLKIDAQRNCDNKENQYLSLDFSSDGLHVGREIVVARALSDLVFLEKGKLGVLEFYRFDGDCKPRLRFEKDRLILGNGDPLELWGRFATWEGLERFIDENIERLQNEHITIAPINSNEDYEVGLCAKTHRAALKAAANKRNILKCVHCELPVTASMSPFVEFGEGPELTVGMSHKGCLRPSDRVLGQADSDLFRKSPELVNFDVNSWFMAAHSGHGVLRGAELAGQSLVSIVWGGIPTVEDTAGGWMIVSILNDGSEHITTKRGRVQRFTRQHADEFSAKLRSSIRQAEIAKDPLCYSDQSGTFSTRTTLMRQLGGKERIQPISHVEVRAFDAREATRYRPPGNWYAPLLVLREEESLELIRLNNVVPAMSDPLSLGIYLENWRNSGFELPSYHIELLLTDFKVDQFIACVTDAGLDVVIDPILSESDDLEVVRGYPIYSLPMLEAMRTTAQ